MSVPSSKPLQHVPMSFFPLWYAPGIGGTTQIGGGGGMLKRFPIKSCKEMHGRTFLSYRSMEFVPPTSKPCRRLWLLIFMVTVRVGLRLRIRLGGVTAVLSAWEFVLAGVVLLVTIL